jgi:hypothetical protein
VHNYYKAPPGVKCHDTNKQQANNQTRFFKKPDFGRLSSYQFDDEKDLRIKRALMVATEISPIIENFNIGNICAVIADICVAFGTIS